VILIDSNILIYAHNKSSPHHENAGIWLNQQLNGPTRVGLPWQCLLSFLRLVSNPRVFTPAEPIADALAQVAEWLSRKNVWTPQPTENHSLILEKLLTTSQVRGNFVTDAHLAALAIEHGLTLCSADSDFAKFPGLRWTNPLVAQPR
jgi:toxin-antitoxin system PIN domain toxin